MVKSEPEVKLFKQEMLRHGLSVCIILIHNSETNFTCFRSSSPWNRLNVLCFCLSCIGRASHSRSMLSLIYMGQDYSLPLVVTT